MNIDREKRILDLMQYSGLTRSDAELAAAIERGEIKGDAELLDDPTNPVNILDKPRP